MAIYRGPGGSGDAVNDSSSETRLAVEARDAALAAQAAAEAAQAAAETAETNAETAETNAETAETNAETAATNAASSASSASSSASAASTSATSAASSASSASTSATNAASSASSASTSASNASTSATNAVSSATTASTAATNASNSASSASTSASTATTKASEASTSATNAASSASSASSSASTATTQAGIATTKASEASTSATNAASSASSASTSATNAASSASSASTSATNASNSATAASSAQSAAEAARDAALSAYDNFDDRYLGPKASDPTLDNDGNALLSGALYFNTTTNVMKVYTGSSWVAAYVSAAGVLLTANNLSDVASVSTARTNLGVTATGSDTTYAYRANNLSDLASASTARTNLGLGTAATTAATDYATAAQGAKADTALQPAAIGVSVQGYDADLGAIAALSGTSGLLKKTAANTWSLDTTAYLSGTVGVANGGTGLTSLTAGYIPFGAGTSAFGNTSNLFWDNTNARLGVGTASPSQKIDVAGHIQVGTGSTSGAWLYLKDADSLSSGFYIGQNSVEVANLWNSENTAMLFATNNTERLRIDSSGNVGIGTSSPSARLDVTSTSNSDTVYPLQVYSNNKASSLGISYGGLSASGALTLYSSGTSKFMQLDTSGNLGLGVTPSAWVAPISSVLEMKNAFALYSHQSLTAGYLGLNTYYGSLGNTYKTTDYASQYYQYQGKHIWQTAPSGTAGTAITFTQAMTLDASGRLGIGTTSPSEKLDVSGSGNVYAAVRSSSSNAGVLLQNPYATYYMLVGGSTFSVYDNGAAATRFAIDSTGNVGIGTSSPASYGVARKALTINGTDGGLIDLQANGTRVGSFVSQVDAMDIYAITAVPLRFFTNSSERFRIGSAGQLGIGGANYGTSGQALVSNGSGSAPSWQTVSGGQYFGTATTKAIAYNSNTISENITVTAGNNGLSAGPVTVSTGYTVTVETGANWVIV